MIEAYPLHWPVGKPRSKSQARSAFSGSQNDSQNFIINEIRLLGGSNPIISTDIKLRQDGLPYASQRQPDDQGVAVYFDYKGQQQCFACDRWDLIKYNMKAIGKTIEALRGIGRWGSGDMVEAAFKGFQALPAPICGEPPWYEVLGFVEEPNQLFHAEDSFKRLARKYHPDNGGTHEKMAQLNKAIDQARKELKSITKINDF